MLVITHGRVQIPDWMGVADLTPWNQLFWVYWLVGGVVVRGEGEVHREVVSQDEDGADGAEAEEGCC